MAKQVQFRRGSTAQHATFTGVPGEMTIDTTKHTLVVHNGVTAGGYPVALETHNHTGVYEPIDATILRDADIGVNIEAYDATILKDADIGVNVAAESHNHTGVYEPIDATILKDADIGVNVEAYDATILKDADINVTLQAYDATTLKDADIGVTLQAYDATTALTSDITYETLNANGDVGTTAGTLAIGNHTHTTLPNDVTVTSTGTNSRLYFEDTNTTNAPYIGALGDELVLQAPSGTHQVTVSDNLIVTGNLTVSGTTTYIDTNTLNISDNQIVLNADETGAPSQNAGIEIERGTSSNVGVIWNETTNKWTLTNDGTTYNNILTVADEGAGNGIDADTLDGQQGSYYLPASSYTAADVLTKIKTVDGSGSGLDADRLDNRHASSLMFSDNANATDLNTITQSGVYRMNNTNPNQPSEVGYGQLLVLHGSSDTIAQLAFDYDSSDIHWRSGNPADVGGNGSWGAWREIYHTGNAGAGSGLDADTVDTLQASQFVRSDAADTVNGQLTLMGGGDVSLSTNGGLTIGATNTQNIAFDDNEIQCRNNGAAAQLHLNIEGGNIALGKVGSTTTERGNMAVAGTLTQGGNPVYTTAHSNVAASGNTLVLRNSSGYVYANYFNTTANVTTATPSHIMVETSSDSFIRKQTPAQFRTNVTDPYYLATASAASASTPNTIAKRDVSGDLHVRLIRSEYDSTNPTCNYIMTQIDTATNNYIRPSTQAQFRAAVTDAHYLKTTGTFTRTDGLFKVQNDAGISITNTGQIDGLQIYQPTVGADAIMSFHVGGDYAIHFGLDGGTNDLAVGGWSKGAASYRVWHAGNDGPGSGLNADVLDGVSSGSFLRSDTADQKTSGSLRFNDNIYMTLGTGDNVEHFCNGSNYYTDINEGMNWYLRDGNSANATRFIFDIDTGQFTTTGNIYVGSGATSSNIYMMDSDETTRRIHCNSNRIGFLTSAGAWGCYADNSGNWVASGNVTAYSDAKLKENVEVIPNAIEKVNQIRGVTFDRNDVDVPRQTGVIAQEVEKVLPEVVEENADGVKTVAYGNMVGLLIEAIKEQQTQIDELKYQIQVMEAKK